MYSGKATQEPSLDSRIYQTGWENDTEYSYSNPGDITKPEKFASIPDYICSRRDETYHDGMWVLKDKVDDHGDWEFRENMNHYYEPVGHIIPTKDKENTESRGVLQDNYFDFPKSGNTTAVYGTLPCREIEEYSTLPCTEIEEFHHNSEENIYDILKSDNEISSVSVPEDSFYDRVDSVSEIIWTRCPSYVSTEKILERKRMAEREDIRQATDEVNKLNKVEECTSLKDLEEDLTNSAEQHDYMILEEDHSSTDENEYELSA